MKFLFLLKPEKMIWVFFEIILTLTKHDHDLDNPTISITISILYKINILQTDRQDYRKTSSFEFRP